MSRRQWTGLAGLLFGVALFSGIVLAGSTPDNGKAGAAERYQKYWSDSGHQDHAVLSVVIISYACVLLVAFAVGLSRLLRRSDDGPLPTLVAAAGAASAALFGGGSALLTGVGAAASETTYAPDGNTAILSRASAM